MKHLRFCMTTAWECNEKRHPQVVMKELGIKYQHATPISIANLWRFWNCEDLPENLPKFLEYSDIDPMDCIGYGLSEDEAIKIRDFALPK